MSTHIPESKVIKGFCIVNLLKQKISTTAGRVIYNELYNYIILYNRMNVKDFYHLSAELIFLQNFFNEVNNLKSANS